MDSSTRKAFYTQDQYLAPYYPILEARRQQAEKVYQKLTESKTSLVDIANNHLYFGLHFTGDQWIFREWLPNAHQVFLIGDFNHWTIERAWELRRLSGGIFEIVIPKDKIKNEQYYRLSVVWQNGRGERLPAYTRRVVQDNYTKTFSAQVWNTPPYTWKNQRPPKVDNPLIYEAHVGMATEEYAVGSYTQFRIDVLPRIAQLGYNVIQLMAIQEHPYYGSFGYQVSNFFAPSSRFGTPEELKQLIDDAHGLGMAVIMDIIHSHAVKNESEGLSKLDGTEYLYFHAGDKGHHPTWDSRCFDYGKEEVITFLLSNCKYWLEEFHFDGFRFDGVTSMMYWHHGLEKDFVNYAMYFDENTDTAALTYLLLANRLIHQLHANNITIAEDVSGMPGLATSEEDGGIGFDFRMSMGVADYWIKIIKEKKDEEWHVGDIFYALTDKRKDEKTIGYAECHDQALVGDQTLIFRLIGKEMYTSMSIFTGNLTVERGTALHKIIRLATLMTAGNGYLNFMGNEFGHPEWIDFPRKDNGWNYHYARRQWSLADNQTLKYKDLLLWDKVIINIAKQYEIFQHRPIAHVQNTDDQVLIFERNNLLVAINFNGQQSFTDYGCNTQAGKYELMACSDDARFGGFERITSPQVYFTQLTSQGNILRLYLPTRTAIVLRRL